MVCSIPSTLEGILVQGFKTQSKYKNRKPIYTLPPLASHTFPCLGPNRPISALFSNSSTNANRTHVVLSCFIVSPARHPYLLEPTHSSPNPVLDTRLAGCEPVLLHSHCRPHLCSGGAYYCAYQWGLGVFGPLHCSRV